MEQEAAVVQGVEMMRSSLLTAVLFVPSATAHAQAPPTPALPTSAAARLAKAEYDAALKKLEADFQKQATELKASYGKDLDAAREAAITAKNLDEAQRILAEQRSLTEGHPSKASFEIIGAWYGWYDRWRDVTPAVKKLVQGEVLQLRTAEQANAGQGDPAFGEYKSLVVVYRHKGIVRVALAGQNKPLAIPSAK